MDTLQMVDLLLHQCSRHKRLRQKGKCLSLLEAFLIDWISNTCFQGYTDLQSLIKCLNDDSMQSSKVVVSCATMHCGQ